MSEGVAATECPNPPMRSAAPSKLNRVAGWVGGSPLGWLALAFSVVIAPLAYAANLGFAPFTAVAGLLCLPMIGRPRAPVPGLWLLLVLLAWGLVSYSWSPAAPLPSDFAAVKTMQRVTGLKLVVELALYAGFALAMRRAPPSAATRALLIAAVLLSAMTVVMLIESLVGAKLYGGIKAALGQRTSPDLAARNVARACYVMALLLWPLLATLFHIGRRGWGVALAAGAVLSAVLFKVDAPIVAFAVGGVVFAAVWRLGARSVVVCGMGAALYFVMTPIIVTLAGEAGLTRSVPGHVGKASWDARLQIWSFVDRLVLDRPLTGWGLDSSRSWPTLIPLHPHDAALQLWLELGPVGAGLAALFFLWLFGRIAALADKDRVAAAAAAASTAAYLVIGALSFGVWQDWWLALGAVTIAVCAWMEAARTIPQDRPASRGKLVPL